MLLVIVVCVGLTLCWAVTKKIPSWAKKLETKTAFNRLTGFLSVMLFLLELVVVQGCYFKTGWDVGAVTHFDSYDPNYFSTYPNQLFLTGIFSSINQLAETFGLQDGYLGCVIVGCLHVSVAVFLIAQIGTRLAGYKAGYGCFILAFGFLGLSPWILVPYSDVYAIFWTTFVFYCYVCICNKPLKLFGIIFGTIVGYSIKPTAIFVFVSVLLIEIICIIWSHSKNSSQSTALDTPKDSPLRKRSVILSIFSALVALVLGFSVVSNVKDIGVEIDESRALSFTHYLMMGFNPETGGGYCETDVLYSLTQPVSERQQVNIQLWKDRISHMGKSGLVKFLIAKSMMNYADGTFFWGKEGSFYKTISGQNDILKKFYSIGDDREGAFVPLFQAIWLFVLFGLVAFCFLRKDATKYECVAMLSILMLSCFLLLFECRARYLFLYAPFYVLLGVLGWKEIAKRLKIKRIDKTEM